MLPTLTRNRLAARVLGVACALAGAGAWAPQADAAGAPASAVVRVRVGGLASASKATQDSVVFELTGSSPARCMPSVSAASVIGADVDVRLRFPATACVEGRLVPFSLTADAASITGTPLPRGTVYHVSVHDEDGNLLAFHALETSMLKNAPTPENGFWWPLPNDAAGAPVAAGSGVGIESQGLQLAINVFGFEDTGVPVWYFAGTRQNGRVASASLVELQHGDGLFATNGKRPIAQPGRASNSNSCLHRKHARGSSTTTATATPASAKSASCALRSHATPAQRAASPDAGCSFPTRKPRRASSTSSSNPRQPRTACRWATPTLTRASAAASTRTRKPRRCAA
jgi:hypothetical protein